MVSAVTHKSPQFIFLRIVLIIFIQTMLLVIMVANRQLILSSDTVVVLETKPIDPRSLFRGDYVRLNYTINELKLDDISGDHVFKKNDIVYIVLQQADQYWSARAIYLKKKSVPEDKQYPLIQGIVKRVKSDTITTTLSVSYGIENYFVPEGEGLKFERPEPGDKVTLEIALDKDGKAVIKALLLNGIQQYEEALF